MVRKKNDLVRQSGEQICRGFSLEQNELLANNMDELRSKLSRVIGWMLDHEFSKFLNAMYRMDVSEEKVRKILADSDPDILCDDLADLVIDRQIEKIRFRMTYRS